MSFKERLDEKLGEIEERLDRLNEQSGEKNQRFFDRHHDKFEKLQDAYCRTAEGVGAAFDRASHWLEKLKESWEDRADRARARKSDRPTKRPGHW